MMGIQKYLLVVVRPDDSIRAEIPIFILPNEPTIPQVQALRVCVERKADPYLYWFCAKFFDLLDMPSAADAVRRRAKHYS